MKETVRQEQKYCCTIEQFFRLKNKLSFILKEDPHNKRDGYCVRSLYFDTLFDTDFYEKVDGIEIRKKMRLRTYNSHDDFAYLEMKQKHGSYQKKRSLKVSKEDAQRLSKGEYSVLLRYEEDFAKECYAVLTEQLYFPKVIVEYDRYAYILDENQTRITFDRNVRSTSSSFDIFDSNLILNACLEPSLVILEVKFNHFLLSYVKDLLRLENPSLVSISKYYYSRVNVII